jgi:hypothetical protein
VLALFVFVSLTGLLVVGSFGGIVALVVWLSRRQSRQIAQAWGAAAQRLGLDYHGEISGRLRGQALRICTETRGSGKNRATYTVVSSRLDMPLDLGLNLRRHGFFNDLFHRSEDLAVGDASFDEAFLVSADEPQRVIALFDDELRSLLLRQLAGGVSFSLGDHGMRIECTGRSRDAEWLLWAAETVSRATQAMERARRRVPGASPLAGHRAAWAGFAAAHGLRGSETPLAMWGELDGATVLAYAVRSDRHVYQLEVSLRFREPLDLGLSVQPMGLMDKLSVFFGGQDLRFGDAPFDQAFRVRAMQAHQVEQVLTADMRRELLALQARLGPLSLDDRALSVRLACVPHDPAQLPRTMDRLRGMLEILGRRAAELRKGPYR